MSINLLISMILEASNEMNHFLVRYRLSKYYSPNMIVCKIFLGKSIVNMQLDLQYKCITNHDKKSMMTRTLDCIYLRPNTSIYGGHELLHLPTNKIIKGFHITSTPVTNNIINAVHNLAQKENMPNGLKISYLYDFIAGMEQLEQQEEAESKYVEENVYAYKNPHILQIQKKKSN